MGDTVNKARRFLPDGTIDPLFGDGGAELLGGFCQPTSMTQDEDGMILVLCDGFAPTVFRIWP